VDKNGHSTLQENHFSKEEYEMLEKYYKTRKMKKYWQKDSCLLLIGLQYSQYLLQCSEYDHMTRSLFGIMENVRLVGHRFGLKNRRGKILFVPS
jgi:hypothetical protein